MSEDSNLEKTSQNETVEAEKSLWTVSFAQVSRILGPLDSSQEILNAIQESQPVGSRTLEDRTNLEERLKPFRPAHFASARSLKPVF